MDVPDEVLAAEPRIRAHVRETPVEPSRFLSEAGRCRAFLKLENLQRTGSFKLRGAMNVLLSLPAEARARGVVAASTGNHGKAVALGASELGCPATIFAPETAAPAKLEAMRSSGVEIRLHGADCVVAENAAREHAAANGLTYVSPYNDPRVIGGQGTIGLELERQVPDLDAVVVAVGGGGLVSGIGGYLKGRGHDVEVVGASPRNSAVMHASLAAGRIVELESLPTLSDGTAGGIEAGAITFDLCREIVDRFVLVEESEIGSGVREVVRHHHVLIEGAAGAAVAAFLREARRFAGRTVVVVLCGANIDTETLGRLLQRT